MKYIFGPVPSRRLSQSLGIDPIPLKTCNWNCIYCQLGRTSPLVNERREFFSRQEILTEVKAALTTRRTGKIDWVTFVGSGEPTLHIGLGWMIRQVKGITDLPVAVITNGSLFYLPEVRRALAAADAVLPSLDAGNARLYRKVNRPWPSLTFERLVAGLASFRKEYAGQLWVEVMLVDGLNDTEEALEEIAVALNATQPDQVHLNLPTRPPSEAWVRPASEAGLMRATAILGGKAQIVHPAEGNFDLEGYNHVAQAVVDILIRHPMREEELLRTLRQWTPSQVQETLEKLKSSGQVQVVERYGCRFWSSAGARFTRHERMHPMD